MYSGADSYMMLYGACGFIAVLMIFIFIVKLRQRKKDKDE